MKNYYRSELDRIDTAGEYAASFQASDEKGRTKNLNLNHESAAALRDWMEERFPAIRDKAPSPDLMEVLEKVSRWLPSDEGFDGRAPLSLIASTVRAAIANAKGGRE